MDGGEGATDEPSAAAAAAAFRHVPGVEVVERSLAVALPAIDGDGDEPVEVEADDDVQRNADIKPTPHGRVSPLMLLLGRMTLDDDTADTALLPAANDAGC